MLVWLAENAIAAAILFALVQMACRSFRLRPAVQHAMWLLVLLKLLTPACFSWPWSPLEFCALQVPSRGDAVVTVPLDEQSLPADAALPDGVALGKTLPTMLPQGLQFPHDVDPVRPEKAAATAVLHRGRGISNAPVTTQRSQADVLSVGQPSEGVSVVADVHSTDAVALTGGNHSPWWQTHWRLLLQGVWAMGACVLVLLQFGHVIKFNRLIGRGQTAPRWFTDDLTELAGRFSMRPPTTLFLEQLSGPLLWCWGRPRLLWPTALGQQDARHRMSGVMAHELAHLRRRDHWVAWLEVVAGCVWWWNPFFWLVRRRLHQSAELACDAWVVWALPEDRRVYAESLVEVSRIVSQKRSIAPACGAMNSDRRSFERRLTMVFRKDVSRRLPWTGAMAILIVAAVALPGWSGAQLDEPQTTTELQKPSVTSAEPAEKAATAEQPKVKAPAKPKPASALQPAVTDSSRRPLPAGEPLELVPLDKPPSASPPVSPKSSRGNKSASRAFAAGPLKPSAPTQTLPPSGAPSLPGVAATGSRDNTTVIESFRLQHRDSLDVLQILGALFERGSESASSETVVLAFVPPEKKPVEPIGAAGLAMYAGPSDAFGSPVPTPNGGPTSRSPFGQPAPATKWRMLPTVAPSWPTATVPTMSASDDMDDSSMEPSYASNPSPPPVRLAVDVRTNTLVARGDKYIVDEISRIIPALDTTNDGLQKLSEPLGLPVIPAFHRDPHEIIAVLRGLGISVNVTTLERNEKADTNAKQVAVFVISGQTDAEGITKLIQSLDTPEKGSLRTYSSDSSTFLEEPVPAEEGLIPKSK